MVSYQIIRPVKMQVPVSLPAFAYRPQRKKDHLYGNNGIWVSKKDQEIILQEPHIKNFKNKLATTGLRVHKNYNLKNICTINMKYCLSV